MIEILVQVYEYLVMSKMLDMKEGWVNIITIPNMFQYTKCNYTLSFSAIAIFRISQQTCEIKLDYQSLLIPKNSSMITLNVSLENANSMPTVFTANIYNQRNYNQIIGSYSSISKSISIPCSSLSSPELVFHFTVNVNNCKSAFYHLHMLSK